MFGYINANGPELKVREFTRYRGFYCGLCHSLKSHYGMTYRLSLSYDATFLIMLLTSLYEPVCDEKPVRCIAHPTQKHLEVTNKYTDYGADMNLLCAWYSVKDKLLDQDSLKTTAEAKALSLLYKNGFKKLKKKYPEKIKQMEKYLKELHKLEADKITDLDKACSLSGMIIAETFAPEIDIWEEDLRMIGYHLGRFIYLMDAWEDIEQDIKSGSYNPLLPIFKEKSLAEFNATCRSYMNMIMAECASRFERLPLFEDAEILRNILYAGVFTKYEMISASRISQTERK